MDFLCVQFHSTIKQDLFVYKSDGKYGLMDYKGRIIIEPKFDKVTINEPEFAKYIKRIDSL